MSKRVQWVGALTLIVSTCVIYQPGLAMGFYLDDYLYIARAGRTDWLNALEQFFDPRVQIVWYRPLQTIQFFLEFNIFGGNADAYHLVNIMFHTINVLLLYAVTWRISKKWIIGFTTAFFYTTFTIFPSAINWVGIVDPLATIFYLLSIWFWLDYLDNQRLQNYLLAFAAFVLGLLSKQTAVTIPVSLFLVQWLLSRKPLTIRQSFRKYLLFVVTVVAFILLQLATPITYTFASIFGWHIGPTIAYTLVQYLTLIFFPYSYQASVDINQLEVGTLHTYAWTVIALSLLIHTIWRKRSRVLFSLCIFVFVNLLLVLPFPFVEHRYLYLPMMAVAGGLALVLYRIFVRYRSYRAFVWSVALGLALLTLDTGLSINASALSTAEWTRQFRAPFSEVQQRHPTLPRNTLLYFIDPPIPVRGGLDGMTMIRYGPTIWVKDDTEPAHFAMYSAAYIYYQTDHLQEITFERDVITQISHSLPTDFENGIRLEGYEVPRTSIKHGTPLVLVLYWCAMDRIERDYALFVRLIASTGESVAHYINIPREGRLPTYVWERGKLVPDAILLPVGAHAPVGQRYKVEIGWYDIMTGERVRIVGTGNTESGNTLTIESFTVEP